MEMRREVVRKEGKRFTLRLLRSMYPDSRDSFISLYNRPKMTIVVRRFQK
jgi:hypothetical protein